MPKKIAATVSTAPQAPAKPPRRIGAGAVLLLIVLLAGAGATGYTLGSRNTPLGIPLPAKRKPLIQTAGVVFKDSSAVDLRINAKVLDKLAPQPDGTAPLDMIMPSERGDFTMKFPYGAQFVNLPDEIYKKNMIDSQVSFKHGHPLFLVNLIFAPRKGTESYRAAAQRLLESQVRDGAKAVGSSEVAPTPDAPFSQFAYVHQGPEGDQEFRDIYVGPYGDYLLVLDFMAKVKFQALAQAQAAKIVASFHTNFPEAERLRPQDISAAVPAK
jgi:hypothetical protein